MNVQHMPTAVTESRERHSYARLQGRLLLLARGLWLTLVVLTLTIFFGSLQVYQARVKHATVTPGEMVRVWKEHFPQLWPKGNRFNAPVMGITPGAVAILSFGMPRVPASFGILHVRFGLDDARHRTLKAAGEELGVTRERMRQIELKVLQKLHEPSCVWKLKDHLW